MYMALINLVPAFIATCMVTATIVMGKNTAKSPSFTKSLIRLHLYQHHLWRNSPFAAKACWTLVICATKTSQPMGEIHAKRKKYDDAACGIVANGLPADFEPASETKRAPNLLRAQP